MKLIFDQNLSHKLVARLAISYPDSTHLRFHNLSKKDDMTVWRFAKANNYTIVSQDSDFLELALVHGFPPKVIWIRSGNTNTAMIASLLENHLSSVRDFIGSSKGYCLEIT